MTAAAVSALPTKDEFFSQVNRTFRVRGPEGTEFEVEMVGYDDVLDIETQETFALTFRAPGDIPAQQSLFVVGNDVISEQELFLVPVKADDTGIYFEAVFNRFKEKK